MLKTNLPEQINSIEDAKKYLTDLYNNGEIYHPDDEVADCLDVDFATGEKMDKLMDRIFELSKGTDFDVYFFILRLDPEYKFED
jgi:ADP-dependent phosphofructokinase/glucokinase